MCSALDAEAVGGHLREHQFCKRGEKMVERKSRDVNKGGKESVHCQTMLQL